MQSIVIIAWSNRKYSHSIVSLSIHCFILTLFLSLSFSISLILFDLLVFIIRCSSTNFVVAVNQQSFHSQPICFLLFFCHFITFIASFSLAVVLFSVGVFVIHMIKSIDCSNDIHYGWIWICVLNDRGHTVLVISFSCFVSSVAVCLIGPFAI